MLNDGEITVYLARTLPVLAELMNLKHWLDSMAEDDKIRRFQSGVGRLILHVLTLRHIPQPTLHCEVTIDEELLQQTLGDCYDLQETNETIPPAAPQESEEDESEEEEELFPQYVIPPVHFLLHENEDGSEIDPYESDDSGEVIK